MSSVSVIAKKAKQPRGGFLKPSELETINLPSEEKLHEVENISPILVGLVVDYMTRFIMGAPIEKAFDISFQGADRATLVTENEKYIRAAEELGANIKGLDDASIINACKLVTFDVWKRNIMEAASATDYTAINPDKDTIDNLRIMVNRSEAFWNTYGPILYDGFTFELTGYSKTVDSGDGDYLTKDTLWDFKVSKSKPTNKHTLQLLMYYIMGKHSKQEKYNDISRIGIFNPRLNTVYLYDMNQFDKELIKQIENDVICY